MEKALSTYESAFSLAARAGVPEVAAEAARRAGRIRQDQGDLEAAADCFTAALAIAEINDVPGEQASALVSLAAAEQYFGRLVVAEELYERAQPITEALHDWSLGAKIELNLGVLANVRGDVEEALRRYRAALSRHRKLGEDIYVLGGLNNIGMAYVDLERWNTAARFFDEAEELATKLGQEPMVASIAINRTDMYLRSGELSQAETECARAFAIFQEMGHDAGLAESHKCFGILSRERGEREASGQHFDRAVLLARRCGDRLLEAETLSEWARLHRLADCNREALQSLNDAYRIFADLAAARELLDLERRLDGLEIGYLQVVSAWAESIESKDEYTAGHCERVANYACMLAEAVGITGRDLTWLRMGGFLHDVGKIAVPAEILNKPGKLTAEEWAVMQSHTTEGFAIVAELNFPWDIGPVVRSHHERWDGSGYPDGLAGEQIPFTARVLCLADVYDALTTTRSYRTAMTREEALEIMEGDTGRIFDPSLFPIFAALVRDQVPQLDGRFPAFSPSPAAA